MRVIEYVAPITGDAAVFFELAERSYIGLGLTDYTQPRPIRPTYEAWIARDDGKIVGIQVMEVLPQWNGQALGVLSYVLPEARGKGVYSDIQSVCEAALIERGVTKVYSHVVASGTTNEKAMRAALEKRGGWIQQYRYCRPLPYNRNE